LPGGSVPVDEALAIAHDLAEALGFAHEQGIVHRDLKPANIKVRDDGTVKVLDFGLAKLAEPAMPSAGSSGSMSPTITSPALMTNGGVLLGTAAYMSPEQAKGKPADKRSDMWAFGCVLFEMLSGKRAFEGEDISETLASVLRSDPRVVGVAGRDAPPAVRALIRRCLEKDRRKRAADCAAALFALDEHPQLLAPAPAADRTAFQRELELAVGSAQRVVERRARKQLIAVAAAALVLVAAASAATWWEMRPPSPPVSRLAFPPAPGALPQIALNGSGHCHHGGRRADRLLHRFERRGRAGSAFA
jgi:serine/threonine-protein kinase